MPVRITEVPKSRSVSLPWFALRPQLAPSDQTITFAASFRDMGKSDAFKVRLSGLKTGRHSFEFVAGSSFFEKLGYARIEKGEVQVKLELVKKPTHLELNFKMGGWTGEICDRCAIAYRQTLSVAHRVYVKFGDGFDEPDDSLIIIPREAHELDVSHTVYEFIRLSIPLRKVPCEESGDTSPCDREVLDLLELSGPEDRKDSSLQAALNGVREKLKEK